MWPKKWGYGYKRWHIQYSMGKKLCKHFHWDGMDLCAESHPHPISNVGGGAPKSPFLCRQTTCINSHKGGILALMMTHSMSDGDETLQVHPWQCDGLICRVSSPFNIKCGRGCAPTNNPFLWWHLLLCHKLDFRTPLLGRLLDAHQNHWPKVQNYGFDIQKNLYKKHLQRFENGVMPQTTI